LFQLLLSLEVRKSNGDMSVWLLLIALPIASNNNDSDYNNKQLGIVLVEKGLHDCPASLEKGDSEMGNSEATPE
jgi:hypothetical protein